MSAMPSPSATRAVTSQSRWVASIGQYSRMTWETARPPRPQASIRSFVDRELTMVTTEDGYELRHEDVALGTRGDPSFETEVECVTRDGAWTFARLRRGDTEARMGTAALARYRSGFLPGGRIELPDGRELRLRPPAVSETWRVRRGALKQVMWIRITKGPWEIGFGSLARDIHDLPLLTMFAFHAMLVEIDRPVGAGGADVGVGF